MSKNKKFHKSKTEKKQFPKNFRFFTENPVFKFVKRDINPIVIFFASFIIFLGILAVSLDAYTTHQKNEKFGKEREKIENEIRFWQSASEKYPNFRDAYFKLAVLNYQLRNFEKSREYLKKVLQIDPNFKEGRELEKKL